MPLPEGWSEEALDAVVELASSFGAEPADILGLFASESGLHYRNQATLGGLAYYGLIMGRDEFVTPWIGASWKEIVQRGALLQQLKAVYQFWKTAERTYLKGDTVPERAAKLGISPAAVLYNLNFVPGYFMNMMRADQPMVVRGGGPDKGAYYQANPGFDLAKKGYITPRDVEGRIERIQAAAMAGAPDFPAGTPELFAAMPVELRTTLAKAKASPVLKIAGIVLAGAVAASLVWYLTQPTGRGGGRWITRDDGNGLRRRAMRIAYPDRDTGGWDPWAPDPKVDRVYARLKGAR